MSNSPPYPRSTLVQIGAAIGAALDRARGSDNLFRFQIHGLCLFFIGTASGFVLGAFFIAAQGPFNCTLGAS